MTRKEKAIELHDKGFNCAQAVACAFADVYKRQGMGCAVYSWIFAVNKERNWCENKIFTRRNGGFI